MGFAATTATPMAGSHRLQLPVRSLRGDFRGPRGRNRRGRDWRPGAGLKQPSTGIACLEFTISARRVRDGCARAADRLEALAARRARPGRGDAPAPAVGTRNRYPGATGGLPACQRRPRRQRDASAGEPLYAQLPACAPAPRLRDPGLGHLGPGLSQRGVRPVEVSGAPALRRRLPRREAPAAFENTTAGPAWTQVTTTAAGPDGAWATSVVLPPAARSARCSPATRRAPGSTRPGPVRSSPS